MFNEMVTQTGAGALKFTDMYEASVVEEFAGDANLNEPTNVPYSKPNRNVKCVEDDGTQFDDQTVITYSIIEGDADLFSIDPDSGVFSVNEDHPFDYEQQPWYIVPIQCTLASNTGNGTVNVSIVSLNEYRPELDIMRPIVVRETTPRGTVIAATDEESGALVTYSASDRDSGPGGVITYSFEIGNNDDRFFDVDQATGKITLSTDLDADDSADGSSRLSVSIAACNEGIELDSCETKPLTIFITAANDLTPEFTEAVYAGSLNESALNGTTVLQVQCVDGDIRVGGVQSVSFGDDISNETLSTFELEFDPVTGLANVSLQSEVDYESTTSYTFSLVCSDGEHSATTLVSVNVLPVNDNEPRFEQEGYEFSVNRADPVPSDTIIGSVRATDADSGVGGSVAYSLDPSSRFSINSETGEISLKDYLSAGDGNTFDFEVIASDGEYEARTAVRVTATGLLSVLEWVYVGIGGTVLLVILVIVGIVVFHHFIKAASTKTIVKEKYRE